MALTQNEPKQYFFTNLLFFFFRVDYVPTEMSKFPAFTICWKFGYKMSVLASYGYTSANASEPLDLGRFPNSTNVVSFDNPDVPVDVVVVQVPSSTTRTIINRWIS